MKSFYLLSCFFFPFSCFAQSWQQQANFPGLERDDAVAVTVGNTAYYGLGFAVGYVCKDDWWSFDKINGWQQKAAFPGAPRQYAAAASLGKYVYVFGGIDQNVLSLNDFWRYDTENDSWENLTSLPSLGRQAPMLIALEDQLLVGLGRTGTTYFDDCWLYDPVKDTFEQAASLPGGARYYPVYANVAGDGVVAHGKDQSGCLNDCWMYNEVLNEWQPMENSPHTGGNYVASASIQQKLIIGAGLNSSNEFLPAFFEFNLATDTWTSLPDFPDTPRKGSSMFVLDEEVYLVNGIDSSFTRLNEVWKLTLNDLVEYPIIVHPNPVYEWVNIYLPENAQDFCSSPIGFSLYDITGRKVLDESIDFGLWFSYDFSMIRPGTYILKLENCEQIGSAVLIKV